MTTTGLAKDFFPTFHDRLRIFNIVELQHTTVMMDITQLLTCIVCLLLMTSSHVSSEECTAENKDSCESLDPGSRIYEPDDSPDQAEQLDRHCSRMHEWINCYATFLSSCEKITEASLRDEIEVGRFYCAVENRVAYSLWTFDIDSTCMLEVQRELRTQCVTYRDLPQPTKIYPVDADFPLNETCKKYENHYLCVDQVASAMCPNNIAVLISGKIRRDQAHELMLIGCPDPRPFGLKHSPEECTQENTNNCRFLHPGPEIETPDDSPQAEQMDRYCRRMREATNCFTKLVSSCDEQIEASLRDEVEIGEYVCAEENRAANLLFNFNIASTCMPVVQENIFSECDDINTFPRPGEIYPVQENFPLQETCKQYETFYKCMNNLLSANCTNDMARFLSGMFRRFSAHGLVLIGCPDPRAIGLERRSSAASLTWEAFKIIAFIRMAAWLFLDCLVQRFVSSLARFTETQLLNIILFLFV